MSRDCQQKRRIAKQIERVTTGPIGALMKQQPNLCCFPEYLSRWAHSITRNGVLDLCDENTWPREAHGPQRRCRRHHPSGLAQPSGFLRDTAEGTFSSHFFGHGTPVLGAKGGLYGRTIVLSAHHWRRSDIRVAITSCREPSRPCRDGYTCTHVSSPEIEGMRACLSYRLL